jgi:DNA-binding response OmpR family regulator
MAKCGRVLVVEDDLVIGQVVADVLTDEGHEVRWATDGRAALAVLHTWRPDIIVLDLMMPAMDGRAFRVAQMRLTEEIGRVPVIVLSGMRAAQAVAEEMGAVAAITKPFDLDDVVTTVGRILDRAPA